MKTRLQILKETWEKIKQEEKETNTIRLLIHMPEGEEEVIINPKVDDDKIKYISEAYDANLRNKRCPDMFIVDYEINNTPSNNIHDWNWAYNMMKNNKKVKLPSWSGYWCIEDDTIKIHCKNGTVIDIRDIKNPIDYTFSNVARKDWQIATEDNTPLLSGKRSMSFSEALNYLKIGKKLTRYNWNGKGQYVFIAYGEDLKSCLFKEDINAECQDVLCLKNAQDILVIGWSPSQTDLFADDWVFAE